MSSQLKKHVRAKTNEGQRDEGGLIEEYFNQKLLGSGREAQQEGERPMRSAIDAIDFIR